MPDLRGPVLALLALLIAAAGLALAPRVLRPSEGAKATGGELVYRGSLVHHWEGPLDGACDLRFQLYDAQVNGATIGDPVVVSEVPVRQGAIEFPVLAALLAQPAKSEAWLAIEVRCPTGEGDFAALGPRLRHTSPSTAGDVVDGWEVPETGTLVCVLPGLASADHAQRPPALDGVEYRLEGGFYVGG